MKQCEAYENGQRHRPSCTGAKILDREVKENQGMEAVQNKTARLGLGGNKFAVTETLRGEMGWCSFEERTENAQIKYRETGTYG